MDHIKKRAKTALIRRINNFKDIESIHTFVDETIEELWAIFDNEWAMAVFNKRRTQNKATSGTLKMSNSDGQLKINIDCKGIEYGKEKQYKFRKGAKDLT